jgi:hypothetical protein
MFKKLKERKVVNLEENCKLDVDIMRTLGNTEIAKLEVENAVLNAENNTLGLRHNNIMLKQENTLFNRLKSSGTVLNILSLLSFAVSTLLSFISGYFVIKNLIKFVGYALIMSICQLIIYVSSKYTTITKDRFFHKYSGLKFMQISMLLVSLTMNIIFVYECFNSLLMVVIMLPLCFVLDYSTIYFSNLGHDYKTLTFHNNNNNKTFFEKLINNFTYNIIRKVDETYYNNHSKKTDPEDEKIVVIEAKKFDKILDQNEQILGHKKEQEKLLLDSALNQQKEKKEDTKKTLKLSQKYKGKRFKIKRSNILKFEQKVKSENVQEVKSKVKSKNDDKLSQKLSRFLGKNYNTGDVIKIKELRQKFDITESKWKTIKTNLPIETKGTKSFYIG